MADIQSWMNELDQERMLVDLCLPGSHDAGVYWDLRAPYGAHTQPVNPGINARCQRANIWEQAMCGSRVFDIRVYLRRDRSANTDGHTEIPTMGHFFKDSTHGRVGQYGGTLMSALGHAARFLEAYPSEFIIFRIGHTECTEKVAEVLQWFRWGDKQGDTPRPPGLEDEDDDNAIHRQGVVYTGAKGNLAHLKYGQLKGKLLLVFDNQFDEKSFKASIPFGTNATDNGYYRYEKYEKYPEYPKMPAIGLSFCGEYLGGPEQMAAALLGRGEKGNWTAASADVLALNGCKQHQNHQGRANHLLWVYWQQTGGNIWENTTAPKGMHARLQIFLNRVSRDGELAMPNVIGHDFVTTETCAWIVKLNRDLKDTVLLGVIGRQ
jgi:hypothetical protein